MAFITANFASFVFLFLQENTAIEMADKLRENGKIYVVVAIIIILFIVFFLYLISVDRKLSKLEQKLSNE